MVDGPADAARNAGKSPQEQGRGAFGFAGLVLDLDACALKRESGEEIALTRGEFALLREFVRRPGRVLSRDFLLDAVVGRRNVPFDRSVDVMVARLSRKIEPEPKQPSVIQTVPGEGYRFSAPLCPRAPTCAAPPAFGDSIVGAVVDRAPRSATAAAATGAIRAAAWRGDGQQRPRRFASSR